VTMEGPLGWQDEEDPGKRRPGPQPPEEKRPRPETPVPRIGSRYTAVVGVLFLVFVIVAGVNTLSNRNACILGQDCPIRDKPLAEFAVTDARGSVLGDANIAQDDCSTSGLPCPSGQQRSPACDVKGAGIIRVCDLFRRPLVISFWFTRGASGCIPQQDVVDAVARRYRGRVNFLSLDVRDSRSKVQGLIADRGWSVPVGIDSDGALSNIYNVGGCPTFVYAYPGGIGWSSSVGELDVQALSRRVDNLLRATRQREREDR
jgi:hypothetical protein